jgi:hypothetical protein
MVADVNRFYPLHFSLFSLPSLLMATPTPPDGIIFQTEFDTYTNDWVDIVTNNKETELTDCFRKRPAKLAIPIPTAQNLNYVSFSALQIAQLVSTVGAKDIRARFLVVRDAPDKEYPDGYPHFALALFATDDLNGRLSAYYLCEKYWSKKNDSQPEEPNNDSPGAAPSSQDEFTPNPLPDALATYWQQNWSPRGEDPKAEQYMFNNVYGYLRGYTFKLGDFLGPLTSLPVPKFGEPIEHLLKHHRIHINFGLHTYYPATPNVTETDSTFGLLVSYARGSKLSIVDPKETAPEADFQAAFKASGASGSAAGLQGPIDDTDVFYDLSHPCPPTC